MRSPFGGMPRLRSVKLGGLNATILSGLRLGLAAASGCALRKGPPAAQAMCVPLSRVYNRCQKPLWNISSGRLTSVAPENSLASEIKRTSPSSPAGKQDRVRHMGVG